MNFYIKDDDGIQQGPFDEETLKQFVEIEKITSETHVRNTMIPSWKPASDIDFLKEALARQSEKEEEIIEENKSLFERSLELIGLGKNEKQASKKTPLKSCFENKYVPDSAGLMERIRAAITDFIIIGAIALLLLSAGTAIVMIKAYDETTYIEPVKIEQPGKAGKATSETSGKASEKTPDEILAEAKKRAEAADKPAPPPLDAFSAETPPTTADDSAKGFHVGSIWTNTASGVQYGCVGNSEGNAKWCPVPFMNQVFYILFTIFAAVAILYYGLSLGFFAQTFGMWFWGIFIVCYDKATPVFLLRAYIFAIAGLLLGILLPIKTVIPGGRAIHDILTGVWVIRIASKND